jgi:hypothetical protein
MSAKSPECYAIDPQADCLRVEVSTTRSLLLPFDQFAFSELISDDKGQRLRLVFATHEVLISGHTLRRIEAAMQRMELSLITKMPDRYHALVSEGQPKICEIVVMEVQSVEPQNSTLN